MSNPVFGKDRQPPDYAETAPAWPPLPGYTPTTFVPEAARTPGVDQVWLDGEWHVRVGMGLFEPSSHLTRCGLYAPYVSSPTRVAERATCPVCSSR